MHLCHIKANVNIYLIHVSSIEHKFTPGKECCPTCSVYTVPNTRQLFGNYWIPLQMI